MTERNDTVDLLELAYDKLFEKNYINIIGLLLTFLIY
jgi:hypothetical protein